ncbi:hypothetical protein ACG74X_19745 [Marivita sp. S0852]|uniref:hypothetical protein n=1 Tax=Marivita sp. S0852 TaxID=3373893 RepID=UPI003982C686
MSQDCAAEEIVDEVLFKTGRAVLSGSFDAFRACYGLPHLIETKSGRRLLETPDELRGVFDEVRRYYDSRAVVDLARSVIEARFLDSDTIGSTHVARLLSETGPLSRTPYPVYWIIRRHGHLDWRVMSSLYAILDCDAHNAALMSAGLPKG